MRKFLFILVAFNLAACASYFKKKDCESVNWFEHGKNVALRGEWLNSDQLVSECRKVEADIQESQLDLGFKSGRQKYCTTETSYQTGKSGDLYPQELCEGPEINSLLSNYKKGIAEYCAKTNGQSAGASGKKYKNLCPKELEPAFLIEYRKGRKKYVQAMIENRQSEIREMDSTLTLKQRDLSINQSRVNSLQNQMSSLEAQKSFTPATNTSAHSYLDARISSLSSDLSMARGQLSSTQNSLRSLERERQIKQDEIASFKAELPSLDIEAP